MSSEKAYNFLIAFIVFIVLIVLLGALYPEYFGFASELITENLGAFFLIAVISIIIYLLAGLGKK